MAVERRVIAAVILRWRRLAALAGGATAGPCPAPKRGGVGWYSSSSLESSSLTTGAPLAGCAAASARRRACARSSSRHCCFAYSLSQSYLDQASAASIGMELSAGTRLARD
jgi:hypothetical protein